MTTKKEPLNNGKKVDQTEKTWKINCAYDQLMPIEEAEKKINPKNPNTHPEVQVDLLAKIISYQGCRSPIVVSTRSGLIIRGHARLEALKRLGWSQVPVDWQDYESEEQEVADMIADNELQRMSLLDFELLSSTLNDFDLNSSDFTEFLALPDNVLSFLMDQQNQHFEQEDQEEHEKHQQLAQPQTEINSNHSEGPQQGPEPTGNQSVFFYKTITVIFTDQELFEEVKALKQKIDAEKGIEAPGHALLRGLKDLSKGLYEPKKKG